jgi:hypothetical protein
VLPELMQTGPKKKKKKKKVMLYVVAPEPNTTYSITLTNNYTTQ